MAKKEDDSSKEEEEKKNPLMNIDKGELKQSYQLEIEAPNLGVEKFYFWVLDYLRGPKPYGWALKLEKLRDLFTATETSAFFGATEMKKATQQEKASLYLKGISEMLKGLFQQVRELRIIDERLAYYQDSKKGNKDAEVALKGIWIDMVEGGSKNPSSVYGLAQTVGFSILPDLFFAVHPKNKDSIDQEINSYDKNNGLGLNRKQREILGRKLYQFLDWKDKTEKELSTRRSWSIKYVRQHYNVIKMYANWIRPYLRNVRQLEMHQRDLTTPELVTAFDTSFIELELLGYKEDKKKEYIPAVLLKFKHTTMPQMAFQEEYQKGAIHTGRVEISFYSFSITKKQIEQYKKKLESDDLELLSSIDETMLSLGDDLKKYLVEAGEKLDIKKEEKEEKKKTPLFEPFEALGKGLWELIEPIAGKKLKKKEELKKGSKEEKTDAEKSAETTLYVTYDVMKKANLMLSP